MASSSSSELRYLQSSELRLVPTSLSERCLVRSHTPANWTEWSPPSIGFQARCMLLAAIPATRRRAKEHAVRTILPSVRCSQHVMPQLPGDPAHHVVGQTLKGGLCDSRFPLDQHLGRPAIGLVRQVGGATECHGKPVQVEAGVYLSGLCEQGVQALGMRREEEIDRGSRLSAPAVRQQPVDADVLPVASSCPIRRQCEGLKALGRIQGEIDAHGASLGRHRELHKARKAAHHLDVQPAGPAGALKPVGEGKDQACLGGEEVQVEREGWPR